LAAVSIDSIRPPTYAFNAGQNIAGAHKSIVNAIRLNLFLDTLLSDQCFGCLRPGFSGDGGFRNELSMPVSKMDVKRQ
jgi:hypothetical protein